MKSILFLALIGMTVANMCGDGSQCPDGSTCCLLSSGSYGCCPYVGATCCADQLHCCPNGYQCDVSGGTCVRQQGANDFLSYVGLMEKLQKSEAKIENVSSFMTCVEDIPAIIADVKAVVDGIKAKDIDGLISLLPKVLADTEKAYADCKDLKNKSVGYKGINECIADVPVFVKEVYEMVKDVEAKDLAALEKLFPEILAEGMRIYKDCSSAKNQQVNLFGKQLNGIEQCKADLGLIMSDFKSAVADIQAKDIDALKALLPQILADAQKLYNDCTHLSIDKYLNYKGVSECVEDLPVFVQEVMDLVKDVQAKDVDAIVRLAPEIFAEAMKLYNDCSSAFRK